MNDPPEGPPAPTGRWRADIEGTASSVRPFGAVPSTGMDPGGIGARPISSGPWAPEGAAPEVGVLGLLFDDEEALHVREDRLDVLRHPCAPPPPGSLRRPTHWATTRWGGTRWVHRKDAWKSPPSTAVLLSKPQHVLKQFPGEAATGRKKEQKTRQT